MTIWRSAMVVGLAAHLCGCALRYTAVDGTHHRVGWMSISEAPAECSVLTRITTVGLQVDTTAAQAGLSLGYRQVTTTGLRAPQSELAFQARADGQLVAYRLHTGQAGEGGVWVCRAEPLVPAPIQAPGPQPAATSPAHGH